MTDTKETKRKKQELVNLTKKARVIYARITLSYEEFAYVQVVKKNLTSVIKGYNIEGDDFNYEWNSEDHVLYIG